MEVYYCVLGSFIYDRLDLEYSCTNSTNQIANCEVSKSHSETSYGVSLLSPQGTVLVKSYCLLPT